MDNFFNWFEYAISKLLEALESIKNFFDEYFPAEEETTVA